MFSKLAFRNIKSQFRDYVVYFITLSIVVSLIFTLVNLLNSSLFKELFENSDNGNIYNIMITCLIVLFVGTLICYINSFLLSNRKKEFGLYLTCGMSKKNITTIFVIENLIVTLIATFVGCILGLIVFNLTAISITNILGIEFYFSTYPIQSFLTTYLYTIIMFSFSMLLSTIYINKVSIYNLINHKNKKRSINNKILIVALIVSLTTLLFTSISSKNILDSFEMIFLDDNNLLAKLSIYIILFFISIVFVCFSLLNLSLNTIIKIKSKSSKGISIFTLREIQDKISINSILIGILSVFMLISFISVCSATTIIKYTDELVEQQYQFDYSLYNIPESGYQFDGVLEEIKDKIDNKFTITDEYKISLYTNGTTEICKQSRYSYYSLNDSFVSVEQINLVLSSYGYEELDNDKFYIIDTTEGTRPMMNSEDVTLSLNNDHLNYGGEIHFENLVQHMYLLVVIPENYLIDMQLESLVYNINTQVDIELVDFNMFDEYPYYLFIRSKEIIKYILLLDESTLCIGLIFAAVIGVMFSFTIIAIKLLTNLENEKRKYNMLSKIGTSSFDMKKSLLTTNLFFSTIPIIVLIIFYFPITNIVINISSSLLSSENFSNSVTNISLITFLGIIFIYLLYFTSTHLLANRKILK